MDYNDQVDHDEITATRREMEREGLAEHSAEQLLTAYNTRLAALTAAYATLTEAQAGANHGDQDTIGAAMKALREAAAAMRVQACTLCDTLGLAPAPTRGPDVTRLCLHPDVPGPYINGRTRENLIDEGVRLIGLVPDSVGLMTLDLDGATATIAPRPVLDSMWWAVTVRQGDTIVGRDVCPALAVRARAAQLAAEI